MGRFVFGCLGFALVIVLLLALAGYFLVWRPVSAFLSDLRAPIATAPQAPGNAQPAYTPPSGGNLTRAQVQRFVRVQRSTREAIGGDFARLENVYNNLGQQQNPNPLEWVGALREVGGVIGKAREANARALQANRFSSSEYRWVRGKVYAALGVNAVGMDLERLARDLQGFNWTGGTPPQVELPQASTRDRELIAPFRAELERNVPLALVGL
ncbi:hypothetical protein HNR42_000328 [Deinobacterium chartae]|uniref:Uncharacterized protein n=1 Tax=Deinobacterium chartae TaxID=521158 RepID=A0A841HVH1_9DEIO|nr:hypothetical protein [Deinobacterium chartae]MBB6096916.1 hypothetical protein [Deinobacterium chartae]